MTTTRNDLIAEISAATEARESLLSHCSQRVAHVQDFEV